MSPCALSQHRCCAMLVSEDKLVVMPFSKANTKPFATAAAEPSNNSQQFLIRGEYVLTLEEVEFGVVQHEEVRGGRPNWGTVLDAVFLNGYFDFPTLLLLQVRVRHSMSGSRAMAAKMW